MTDATFDRLKKILAGQVIDLGVDPAQITMDSIFTQLGLDSLDRVEVVINVEIEFGIEISDHDASTIENVRQMVETIDSALLRKAA